MMGTGDSVAVAGKRVRLTTDGHKAYLQAVEEAFGADIDYSMLIKLYGEPPSSPEAARRYSPSDCVGTRTEKITETRLWSMEDVVVLIDARSAKVSGETLVG